MQRRGGLTGFPSLAYQSNHGDKNEFKDICGNGGSVSRKDRLQIPRRDM